MKWFLRTYCQALTTLNFHKTVKEIIVRHVCLMIKQKLIKLAKLWIRSSYAQIYPRTNLTCQQEWNEIDFLIFCLKTNKRSSSAKCFFFLLCHFVRRNTIRINIEDESQASFYFNPWCLNEIWNKVDLF